MAWKCPRPRPDHSHCSNFTKEKTLLEQIQNLERISDNYRKTSGNETGDDIMLTTLLWVLPNQSTPSSASSSTLAVMLSRTGCLSMWKWSRASSSGPRPLTALMVADKPPWRWTNSKAKASTNPKMEAKERASVTKVKARASRRAKATTLRREMASLATTLKRAKATVPLDITHTDADEDRCVEDGVIDEEDISHVGTMWRWWGFRCWHKCIASQISTCWQAVRWRCWQLHWCTRCPFGSWSCEDCYGASWWHILQVWSSVEIIKDYTMAIHQSMSLPWRSSLMPIGHLASRREGAWRWLFATCGIKDSEGDST